MSDNTFSCIHDTINPPNDGQVEQARMNLAMVQAAIVTNLAILETADLCCTGACHNRPNGN